MTPDEARSLLGVSSGAGAAEVRAAYRRKVLAHHPDRHAGDADATDRTAALNEAFRVLRSPGARPAQPTPTPSTTTAPHPPPPAPAGEAIAILRPDRDSLAVVAPAEDVLLWLHGALASLGDVTYLDPDAGLLEARMPDGDGVVSVVISLQGRGDGSTEAFCSAERLSGSSTIDLSTIVDRIVERLAAG